MTRSRERCVASAGALVLDLGYNVVVCYSYTLFPVSEKNTYIFTISHQL